MHKLHPKRITVSLLMHAAEGLVRVMRVLGHDLQLNETNKLRLQQWQVKELQLQLSHQRLLQPRAARINSRLCFVIMPFANNMKVVQTTIEDILKEQGSGICCMRADQIAKSGRITEAITEHIQKARFLIADITKRNSNVIYELGLAHAWGKKVIVLNQDDNDVPFDIQDYRYIKYDPNDFTSLREKLPCAVKSCISTIPESPEEWDPYYLPPGCNGPYIKISSVRPTKDKISLDEPFEITLIARNAGGVNSSNGYFSVSFPGGVNDLKIETNLDSGLDTKIGLEGHHWANEREVLRYPIAEGRKESEKEPVWKSNTEYSIKVSGYAKARGLLWFYVNACYIDEANIKLTDPHQPLLDIDQREENVYCGVIEVI